MHGVVAAILGASAGASAASPDLVAARRVPRRRAERRLRAPDAGRAPAHSRRVRQGPAHRHVPVLGVDRRAHRRHSLRRRRQGRHGRALVRAGDSAGRAPPQARGGATRPACAMASPGRGMRTARQRTEYLYERGSLDGRAGVERSRRPACRRRGAPARGARSRRRTRNSSRASSGRSPRTGRAAIDGRPTTFEERRSHGHRSDVETS